MKPEIFPGITVFSKKGRDKGRCFVVLYVVDANFAFVADGDTHKLVRPKKKRLKHLRAVPYEFPELIEKYGKHTLLDSDIRKALYPVIHDIEDNREG